MEEGTPDKLKSQAYSTYIDRMSYTDGKTQIERLVQIAVLNCWVLVSSFAPQNLYENILSSKLKADKTQGKTPYCGGKRRHKGGKRREGGRIRKKTFVERKKKKRESESRADGNRGELKQKELEIIE